MWSVVQWLILLVLEDSSPVNFGSVADSVRLVLRFKDFADLQGFFFSVKDVHISLPKESLAKQVFSLMRASLCSHSCFIL